MTEEKARMIFKLNNERKIQKVFSNNGDFIILAYNGDNMLRELEPWYIVRKDGKYEHLLFKDNIKLIMDIQKKAR